MSDDKFLLKRANELQKECNAAVAGTMKKNKSISYQDAVNTFFYFKIAQLEEELSTKQTKSRRLK